MAAALLDVPARLLNRRREEAPEPVTLAGCRTWDNMPIADPKTETRLAWR